MWICYNENMCTYQNVNMCTCENVNIFTCEFDIVTFFKSESLLLTTASESNQIQARGYLYYNMWLKSFM